MMNSDLIVKLRNMGKDIKILYVEDDDLVLEQIKKVLKKVFKHVDSAKNAKEGLALYKAKRYDIVITDIEMPQMSGIEMIKIILKLKEDQIIVVTSAYNDTNNLTKLIEYGIEKFILKPFDINKFFITISKIVVEIYNKKKQVHLQEKLDEKSKLNQLLLDNIVMPIVVLNHTHVLYINNKFKNLITNCKVDNQDFQLSSIFENEYISSLNNEELIEHLYHNESEHIIKNNKNLLRFKIKVTPIQGTSKILLSFFNIEAISVEMDKLRAASKLDTTTSLCTRETFVHQMDTFLDDTQEYNILCFGVKNLKEFIRIYGVANLQNIYAKISANLNIYLKEEIINNDVKLFYFTDNSFIALVKSEKQDEIKKLLLSFGKSFRYSSKASDHYEAIWLDVLHTKLEKTLSIQKNLANIENILYMLKGNM